MSITSEIRLRIKKEGDVALVQLSKKLNDVASRSVVSNKKFKDLAKTLRENDASIRSKSINTLNDYSRAWRELANSVDVTSKEFRQATQEAQRFERQAAKAQGRRRTGGAGGALAAIGSAGLLGPEALIGAGAGALFGSPLAGAAIGSTVVAPLRQFAGQAAEQVADIRRFQIALAGVSDDLDDYKKSTDAVSAAQQKFLLPLDQATKQYTRLKASVRGAGLTTEDTTTVFNGISAAIIATGGSAEDLNSALVATSQVFSKGKVSAEELRQQIGERLPGAFTIFAQSIGKTPAQLDKALEDGKVSLEDFLTFTRELSDRYGESVEQLATAPENAGKRLEVALTAAIVSYGGFFQKVGAFLQDNTAQVFNWLSENDRMLKQYITDWVNVGFKIAQVFTKIGNGVITLTKRIHTFLKATQPQFLFGDVIRQALRNMAGLNAPTEAQQFSVEDLFGKGLDFKFGTGLGQGPLPTGDLDADDEKRKKMRTSSEEMLALALRRNEAARNRNDLAVALLDYEMRLQQNTERMNAKEIDFNTAKIKDLDDQKRLADAILRLREKEKRELAELSKKQKEANKELTEAEKLGQTIVTTFAQGMGDALISLIDKAKSFREVMGDLLKQVGKLLINFGMQALGKGLFPSLFPARAAGGPVRGRFPYIVGERGPELFMPQQSGHIIPNHQLFNLGGKFMPMHPLILAAMGGIGDFGANPRMRSSFMEYMIGGRNYGHAIPRAAGGPVTAGSDYLVGERGPEMYVPRMSSGGTSAAANVVVNVDATGSSVQGDQPNANKLGEALGAAVRAELIKQKRPGGLLS